MPSFSSTKNLTELNLGNNQLCGSILSTNWSALSKLFRIEMGNNSLNGTIPASFFGIPSLQRMVLSRNRFIGRLNRPSELVSSSLEYLDLSDNKLAGHFPAFIFQFRSLQYLGLSSNNLSGSVYLTPFQQLKNLSHLDLSYNDVWINDTGIDPVSFPRIESLSFASCNLTRLPAFLKGQSQLWHLDLSNNQIGGEIPDWIWSLENLVALNLSRNFLLNLREPRKGFNRSLSSLDLSSNKLQGELPRRLPSAVYVDFSSNNFSSAIPIEVGDFLGLTYFFSLANNNLHGTIPRSICNVAPLKVLILSNNSLNGDIPQCLFGMEKLRVLNLRGNSLSGEMPDTFPSNCKAEILGLNGNRLEGKIPRSLANCGRLELIDLGNNQINDVFPSHLENMSRLQVLDLRSNNLHGAIDCVDGSFSWPRVQIVDLASNQFSGELPVQCLRTWKRMMTDEQVSHSSYLKFSTYYHYSLTLTTKGFEVEYVNILTIFTSIDFSSNNFEGRIPDVMGEFKALGVLNLSHNSFTNLIPSSLGNLWVVESLDLSSNNLSGVIPPQLVDLLSLETLNVSHNQLEGKIPSGGQFSTFGNDTYKDNKGLCGAPLKESCIPDVLSCSGKNGGYSIITNMLVFFFSSFFLS